MVCLTIQMPFWNQKESITEPQQNWAFGTSQLADHPIWPSSSSHIVPWFFLWDLQSLWLTISSIIVVVTFWYIFIYLLQCYNVETFVTQVERMMTCGFAWSDEKTYNKAWYDKLSLHGWKALQTIHTGRALIPLKSNLSILKVLWSPSKQDFLTLFLQVHCTWLIKSKNVESAVIVKQPPCSHWEE